MYTIDLHISSRKRQIPRKFILNIALFLGNLCLSIAVPAQQKVPDIAGQIESYVLSQVIAPAQTDIEVDTRALGNLPNARCDRPLDISKTTPSLGIGNMHVMLNCTDGHPWRAALPLIVRGIAPIVVSTRSLVPGHTVRDQDLRVVKFDISTLHNGYFTDAEPVIGALIKRAVAPGMPVYAYQLRPPFLIKRGEKVFMTTENSRVSIRMMGEALKDGALGDIIPVRNLSSRRVVEGIVTRRQEVAVKL